MILSPSVLNALDNESLEIFKEKVTELKLFERATRLIDGDKEDSMEKKKTEGYF